MSYQYCNLANFKIFCDSRVLVQLTNDDDTIDPTVSANINETVLAGIENDAAHHIDNYMRNVYVNVPFVGADITPDLIKLTADLAICKLWDRRGYEPTRITELRKEVIDRMRRMMTQLDEVRKGKMPKKEVER